MVPPAAPGFDPFGRTMSTMPAFFLATAREYGNFVRLRSPFRAIYLITEPAYVEQVLVTKAAAFMKGRGTQRLKRILGTGLLTSEQPRHLRHRRLMQPAFHKKRIEGYASIMVDAARERAAAWTDGATVEVDREAHRLALEIVARAVFGVDLSGEMDGIAAALDTALAAFPASMLPFGELFDHLPVPTTLRIRRAKRALHDVVTPTIERHRAGGGDPNDLLSMLLGAGEDMDDDAVRDEALTILLAGHETTANAIAWTFYLLARHPDVEAKFYAHVDAVLGERDATAADVPALDYVRAVFAETMRLYPPVWVTARRTLEAVKIGPYALSRGDIAIVSQFVSHRDPRYFPEPEQFRPERWLEAPPPKYAYYPFGGGTRICIGESFAWMEGVLVLATLAQRARLSPLDSGDVETLPVVTLRPRTPIRMTVSVRARERLRSAPA